MKAALKIWNKYKSIPIQVKASVGFAVCSILQNSLSIITMPIYTRMLTTEQYGLSTVYFAWLDIISIFTSLKLSAGVFNNGMIQFEDDRDRFQASMQGLSTVSALVCFGIYFLFRKYFDALFDLPRMLVYVMFIYCIFYSSVFYWTARQRYEYKYVGFTVVTLGMAVITSIASVVFIIFSNNKGVMKIIGYSIAATIINLGFYIYIMYRGKSFYHRKYWLYALKFNLPLIPHYLSMIVLNQCDRIMIADMCSESEAAIYGVAYNVGKIGVIFNSAITASFTPWIYAKLKKSEYDDCSKVSFSLFALVMIIAFSVMLFGPEVVSIFATKEYMQAIYVIPPIAAQVFFIFVYNQVSTVEFYYGKSNYIMVASVTGAVLNIVLNYFGIKYFGYIAAAYTSLICYILFAICHFVLMKMLCRKNEIKEELFDKKKIILLSLIIIMTAIISNILYRYIFVRYILIIGIVIIIGLKHDKIINSIKRLKIK